MSLDTQCQNRLFKEKYSNVNKNWFKSLKYSPQIEKSKKEGMSIEIRAVIGNPSKLERNVL